jgi:hypothetical protein
MAKMEMEDDVLGLATGKTEGLGLFNRRDKTSVVSCPTVHAEHDQCES